VAPGYLKREEGADAALIKRSIDEGQKKISGSADSPHPRTAGACG
jgi:hypothetical protein